MLEWLVVVEVRVLWYCSRGRGEAYEGDLFSFYLPMKRSWLEAAIMNRWWCGLDNISVHPGVSRLHPRSFVPRPAEIPPPCSLAKGHELRVTWSY